MSKVFFEVEIAGVTSGKIVFELFEDLAKKTTDFFKGLCTSEKLSYKGTKFHRIINLFLAQGGDLTSEKGTGVGKTSSEEKLPDDYLKRKHDAPYLLSMVNTGTNTNNTQFFITFVACPWFDGKNIVFGKVVEGKEIVDKIHQRAGTSNGKPNVEVKIIDCGLA